MITAIVKSLRGLKNNRKFDKHRFKIGEEYQVEEIDISGPYAIVMLENQNCALNLMCFDLYEDGKIFNPFLDSRFNKKLGNKNDSSM